MRPFKPHASYCIYRKETKTGYFWYVRYWDETSRKYAYIRSTGIPVKGRGGGRHDAEEAARAMLETIHSMPEAPDKSLIQYIADFWTPDSPYVRECAQIKKKPLSAGYIKLHHEDVKRHIEPFPGLRGVTLRNLTAGMIRDWMTWAVEKGMSGRRINTVLQSMRIAVRYAVSREELDRDPFKNIGEAEEQPKEKGVLTSGEVSSLIRAPMTDPRARLVEVKAPVGRPSPEQRQFPEDIKTLGGMAIVAKSYRDIETALLEAGYNGIVAGPLFGGEIV